MYSLDGARKAIEIDTRIAILSINLQHQPIYVEPCYCQLVSKRKTYICHACLVESTKKAGFFDSNELVEKSPTSTE